MYVPSTTTTSTSTSTLSSNSTTESLHTDPNIVLPIRRGEFVMIRGPSGGGKTSLLNIIGTLDTPTDGTLKLFQHIISQPSDYILHNKYQQQQKSVTQRVWRCCTCPCRTVTNIITWPLRYGWEYINGSRKRRRGRWIQQKDITSTDTTIDDDDDINTDYEQNEVDRDNFLSQLRLNRIGFVFQSFNLLPTLSALENVELPLSLAGIVTKKIDRHKKVLSLLSLVGLEERANHLPSELSGGEQQRVAIARSLANNPDLLLLDEPTGDLDTRNTVIIMDLLLKINQEKQMTCVMTTHNPDLECYADRIIYIADGRIVGQVINTVQTKLDYETYAQYLHRQEDDDDEDTDDEQSNISAQPNEVSMNPLLSPETSESKKDK